MNVFAFFFLLIKLNMFIPGPYAAYAPLHLRPAGMFGSPVGRHVDPGVSSFPFRPHPHRPCQDVPADPHLHRQRDCMRKL